MTITTEEPIIKDIPSFKLAGIHIPTSLAANQTYSLWSKFMPRVKEISERDGQELYSVEIYSDERFETFTADTPFDKWAAVKVNDEFNIPEDLKILHLEGGLYAVFTHRGHHSEFHKTFRYIFSEWLPNSKYEADSRPHVEVMGPLYKNNDPDSEEQIWIPIRNKV